MLAGSACTHSAPGKRVPSAAFVGRSLGGAGKPSSFVVAALVAADVSRLSGTASA
jgi:hypothetical protein